MPTERVVDVVIAGAGMAGIAAAYQLAVRNRVRRVVLVDPREPLSLTSSKGTEAYRNYWPGPDDSMARLMDRSIDLLDALDRESGHAFELNRRGYVFLTADPAEAERLRAHAGPTAQFLEGERAIRARYPFVTDRVQAISRPNALKPGGEIVVTMVPAADGKSPIGLLVAITYTDGHTVRFRSTEE